MVTEAVRWCLRLCVLAIATLPVLLRGLFFCLNTIVNHMLCLVFFVFLGLFVVDSFRMSLAFVGAKI